MTKSNAPSTQDLKAGSKAPSFQAYNQKGELISLSDFKGKKVILYFYPKDNTPGCTTEACDFRDNFARLTEKNIAVIGVSKDSVSSHEKFVAKYDLPFTLISDESTEICQAYNVWQEKSMMGKKYMGIVRTTYAIDEEGSITHIWNNVKAKGHVDAILKELSIS